MLYICIANDIIERDTNENYWVSKGNADTARGIYALCRGESPYV